MTKLCRIHANVFALPKSAVEGRWVTLRGLKLPTIAGKEGGPPVFDATLPITFETMQQRLLALPRSDCEPDGFFLLTGGAGKDFWRLNGHMHEFNDLMHRIELNGECPQAAFDDVLRSIGWPDTDLAFELVMEGVTLNEASLRAWATAKESSS